ncbi:sigma-70 family RNA polymerase sigma factor [Streptomyces goshikiensis]|uniref:sigma-70 family RNA polymerase sigma factor n=1 Tax=Streptomyces goshikiensis TaxID=1942 RepID=UPI002AE058A3|nr:sigma-70 family RNA polymerase sigma factor [Streptomyces goshikiensis]
MTELPPPDSAGTREPREIMPNAYWAFHALYHRPYYEYARVQLGTKEDAERMVHGTFLYLAVIWTHVTSQANVAAFAWSLHKVRVANELIMNGREPAGPETMVFDRAVKAATTAVLRDFREQFRAQMDALESSIGLYAAMDRLPERQFDVMVLCFALKYSTERAARIMGITPATVRTLRCSARRKIASEMGLEIELGIDDEE